MRIDTIQVSIHTQIYLDICELKYTLSTLISYKIKGIATVN